MLVRILHQGACFVSKILEPYQAWVICSHIRLIDRKYQLSELFKTILRQFTIKMVYIPFNHTFILGDLKPTKTTLLGICFKYKSVNV